MSKSQKVAILMVLAIICAAVSGFGIYKYCNSTKGVIYVFNNDYHAGEKITAEMFSPLKVDATIIDNGKKAGLSTYYITGEEFKKVVSSNEYLLNDVSKEQPLTFNDLALSSGTSIERSLSGDMMAVTIPISGAAAVTDDLRVGSIVNIYSTSAAKTELLFENMKIIARNREGAVSSVTFETDPSDTLALINAANNYKLYFALAQPVSDDKKPAGGIEQTGEDNPQQTEDNSQASVSATDSSPADSSQSSQNQTTISALTDGVQSFPDITSSASDDTSSDRNTTDTESNATDEQTE